VAEPGAGPEVVDPASVGALECRQLRKSYGERLAVEDISFGVAPGECYGLLGPNGAGKTTTIAMVCGLLDPDAGEVRVYGITVRPGARAAKAEIGYVPQDLALYPDLSAKENLSFFGRLYGLSGARLHTRITDVLEIAGLADRADERVARFSGGMKRRVNIAAGLLHEPRLLVLDEPTVGVDPQSRNAILQTVTDLVHAGMAVLYTTHYMEEAARLCDRIGIIDAGRLVAEGTRRELIKSLGGEDKIRVLATASPAALDKLAADLRALQGVREVVATDEGLELLVGDGRELLPVVVATASATGIEITGADVVEPDLEDVFLELTGKELRD